LDYLEAQGELEVRRRANWKFAGDYSYTRHETMGELTLNDLLAAERLLSLARRFNAGKLYSVISLPRSGY